MDEDARTWADLVRETAERHGVTGLTDEDVDFLLWERTPFPMGSVEQVTRALEQEFTRP